MGAVFLASRDDDEYHKQVAVKFLHPGFDSSDLLNRFRNERQTLAGLDHPNIVKLLDGGSTPEGLPFLVMDYVEGSPIDEYCDQLKLCIDERLHLFSKVCEAVQYAHQKFVVHRDLKPSNILVAADGTPRLLDFGIAKVLNSQPSAQALSLTKTGARYVTPAYASPEQMSGGSINTRADIYSLGVVLYELLTGHRPYRLTQQTPAEIERAICEQDPETPSRAVSRMETDTSSSGIPITKTPEAMSETREGDPQKLRRRLRGDLDNIVLKALQKEPQRRYDSVAEFSQDIDRHLQHLPVKARPSTLAYRVSKFVQRHKTEVSAAVLLVTTLGVVFGGMLWRSRQSHKLTEKDTIVLAGFVNSTGDPVFDGALRQGVSAQLEQSPFLNLLSDERVAQTLSRLAQPADAQLTHKLASEVCRRTASTATIEGSISRLGKQYVLGLKAVNCHNGDLLAEEQVTANDKEQVLSALRDAATRLRKRLGESAVSVQKYDVPLEDVTTPSLEALNAYSLGRKTKDSSSALPFLKRAVELDPNFAMAYRAMAVVHGNRGEVEQAAENARQAYERREKVSERERFSIEISYYVYTTGELEKAAQEAEMLQQTYPKDYWSYVSLSFTSDMLGKLEKALKAAQEALRLDPNNAFDYWRVGLDYIQLDRLNEAEAVFKQAEERKLDAVDYWPLGRYRLAFFEGDTARMKQLETVAKGESGIEPYFLA
jgi:serine/threonine protein kinase/tetratricopeptide (TPR) repeat protein